MSNGIKRAWEYYLVPGTFENQLLKSWLLSEHKPQYLAIVKKILTYQVHLWLFFYDSKSWNLNFLSKCSDILIILTLKAIFQFWVSI